MAPARPHRWQWAQDEKTAGEVATGEVSTPLALAAVLGDGAPAYWEQVSASLGSLVGQCAAQACPGSRGGQAAAGAATAKDALPSKAGAVGSGAPAAGKKTEKRPQVSVPVLPKAQGPVRAQRVNKFLTEHMQSFGGHDFFGRRPEELELTQQMFQDDSLLISAQHAMFSPTIARPRGTQRRVAAPEAQLEEDAEFRPPDHTFQPKGLESFICKVQQSGYRKRKATMTSRSGAVSCMRQAKRSKRSELLRAEGLFRKLDFRENPSDAEDVGDEDDDDDAPMPFIPA